MTIYPVATTLNIPDIPPEYAALPAIIGRRYRFQSIIGKGSFGVVFAVESGESRKLYAAKVELKSARSPKLEQEYARFRMMQGNEGFPEVRYFWSNKDYNAVVMELLGDSLDVLHR
ncbi:MAG: hypothetical protein EZS28_010227 [Streblomastix strix]|uniref:Protein kinase domain-containing protein n=1 Tax=Streblomastix strix TaxID=222440 RepID=A0A5J4WHV9_9EUKA|nr:MAG: hypothetical protein EZS28_010227 [Streblomastix strix]